MAEYIEREALVRQIICNMAEFVGAPDEVQRHDEYCNYAINIIEDAPAVNVAPVRHGRWLTHSDRPDSLICSVCECGFDMWKHDKHNFCPNCGAKMDLE